MEDGKGRNVLEYVLALVESQEIGLAHRATIQSLAVKKKRHQAIGLAIGEGLEHDTVHDGENGCVGPDS